MLPKLLQKSALVQHSGASASARVVVGVCGPAGVQVEAGRMTLEAGKQALPSSLLSVAAVEGLDGVREPQAWLEKRAAHLRAQAGAGAQDVVAVVIVAEGAGASGRLFLLRKLPSRG